MMEGLRLDDWRFGGGFTRPHQTVCLHWNICFCLKVIAELLMGPFLMGFPLKFTYNIIQIISNNRTSGEYGCFGIVSAFLLQSVNRFSTLTRASRQRLQAGTPRKMENPGPHSAVVQGCQRMGWGQYPKSTKIPRSMHSTARKESRNLPVFLGKKMVNLVWHPPLTMKIPRPWSEQLSWGGSKSAAPRCDGLDANITLSSCLCPAARSLKKSVWKKMVPLYFLVFLFSSIALTHFFYRITSLSCQKCHQNLPMMQCGLHVVSHVTVDGCKLHFCNVGIPGDPIEDKGSSCLGQKVIYVVRLSRLDMCI